MPPSPPLPSPCFYVQGEAHVWLYNNETKICK